MWFFSCVSGGNADVDGGYGNLIARAASSLNQKFIKTHAEVKTICYGTNGVSIELDGGETLQAKLCICTIPLGVLKVKHEQLFSPILSAKKREAIEMLGVASLNKVTLVFEEIWWEDENVDGLDIACLSANSQQQPWSWWVVQKSKTSSKNRKFDHSFLWLFHYFRWKTTALLLVGAQSQISG